MYRLLFCENNLPFFTC